MNKLLVMCEGSNEKKIIELLLENDKLKFKSDDLVGLVPYHARQLNSPIIRSALSMYNDRFDVLRIGDKQTDEMIIPRDMKHRVNSLQKYCTKPELEILLIINEGVYLDYLKSKKMPKQYAKENIVYHKEKYDNSSYFYEHYYGNRVDELVNNIKEYKRIKKHQKDELYLADLLK